MRVRATRAAAVVSLASLIAGCGGQAAKTTPIAGGVLQPSLGTSDTVPSASGIPAGGTSAPGESAAPQATASAAGQQNGTPGTSSPPGTRGPSGTPTLGAPRGSAIVVNKSCRKPASSVGTGLLVQKGQKPPAFTATTVDCNDFDFAAYSKGKPTLVDFFASWCDADHKEAKDLEEVYEKYHSSIGFQVVGVETKDESGTAAWFYNTAHWTVPSVWDDGEKIANQWGKGNGATSTCPAAYWIHPDGTISSIDVGEMSGSSQMRV